MDLATAVNQFIEWRAQNRKPRTINGYISNLLEFALWLRDGSKPVKDIIQEDVERWVKLHKDFGYSSNTVGKKITAIQMFFNYCIVRGWEVKVRPDLLLPPRKEFVFPRVAKEEDYQKLISVIPGKGKYGENYWNFRDKALIMLLHDTFARNSEIRLLQMDDLNLERKSARIKTGKSRGTIPFREVFWKEEANSVLNDWLKKREKMIAENPELKTDYVFFSVRHRAKRGSVIPESYVGEIFRKWSNRAGLEKHINPHSLRHLGGRNLAMKGVIAPGISSLLGHKQVQSSFPYTFLFGKDREDLYRENVGD